MTATTAFLLQPRTGLPSKIHEIGTIELYRSVFRSDYSLQILSTLPIQKGETIYISYTQPFLTTLTR
jgi:hypothetical protein